MTDVHDRAVRAATSVTGAGALPARELARRIQDAALRSIDARVLQRVELIDREFDRTDAELHRAIAAAQASAPAVRRFSPFPDLGAMFAAGFGGGLAIGAGQVVSRTPAGQMALVGPSVLVLSIAAAVLLIVGALVARREGATSTNRVLFLWFTVFFALVAIVGVSVRLVAEEFTGLGVAAAAGMAVVLVLALVLAVGATRRRTPGDDETTPRVHAGARERNELRSASENAQDRAHAEIEGLDEGARAAFAAAYAAGLAAIGERDAGARPVVKRLRSLEWAAARYDLAG